MVSVIERIKEKLNTSLLVKYSEEVGIVDFVIEIEDSSNVTKEIIQELLNIIPIRDDVEITAINDAEDGIQIKRDTDLDLYDWDIFNGDSLKMSWHINKKISEQNVLSIYCYDKFCDTIENKPIQDVMLIFSQLLADKEFLCFEVQDSDTYFVTRSISFVGRKDYHTITNDGRIEMMKTVRDNTNFRNGYMYALLPGDFAFHISGLNNRLADCFSKIETLLAICYISNDAEIMNSEKIEILISGQRNVSIDIKLQDIVPNKEIVKIYNWIYEGGNATDKAIIARNILSLHCRYSNIINLDGKTFASIQSNFNLYQRDNVDRYLDLKNNVGKSVTEIIEKSNELAFSIPHGMKRNILALFSFLFTVILANIVSDAPLDNIFTRDITVIFEVIIFFSVIFMFFSVYETNYKIKQMQEGFCKLKNNYEDIFDEEELKEIIDEEDFNKNVIIKIKKQRNWSIFIWILLLIILLIAVEKISSASTWEWLVNLLVKLKQVKK